VIPQALRRNFDVVLPGLGRKAAPARPRPENVLIFYKMLASAVEAGLSVSRALEGCLVDMHDRALKRAVEDVARRVSRGETLSGAMARWPLVFSPLACGMIRTAERAGGLATSLRTVAAIEHRALTVRRTIRGAMVYPSLVVGASIAVAAMLGIVVLPKFAQIFEAAGTGMPLFTRAVMLASVAILQGWWIVLPAAVASSWAAWRWASGPAGRRKIDELVWSAPRIGPVVRKLRIAHVSRTLAGILGAGVPLVDGLALAEGLAGNAVLQNAIASVRGAVERGMPFSAALRQAGVFPGILVQLAANGEQTGQLPRMLEEYARIAEEDAEATLQAMLRLVEPAMLVMVGGMVAWIAVSVYVPLSRLGSVISGR